MRTAPADASAEFTGASKISQPLTHADIDSDEKLKLFVQQQREARIRAGEEVEDEVPAEKIPIDKDAAIDEFLASLEPEKPTSPDALKAADKLLEEIGEPYTPPPPKPPKSAETPDLESAPGCFGFALVYDAGNRYVGTAHSNQSAPRSPFPTSRDCVGCPALRFRRRPLRAGRSLRRRSRR